MISAILAIVASAAVMSAVGVGFMTARRMPDARVAVERASYAVFQAKQAELVAPHRPKPTFVQDRHGVWWQQ